MSAETCSIAILASQGKLGSSPRAAVPLVEAGRLGESEGDRGMESTPYWMVQILDFGTFTSPRHLPAAKT